MRWKSAFMMIQDDLFKYLFVDISSIVFINSNNNIYLLIVLKKSVHEMK